MRVRLSKSEANIFQVYNQYRVKHGIPFPDEISGIREHYGLSAAKMAQILGFGINQYRSMLLVMNKISIEQEFIHFGDKG